MPLVEQEMLTLFEHLSSLLLNAVRVTPALVVCVCFDRSLLISLYFFFWPVRCLFIDIRFLFTPLVSSNSSLVREKKTNTDIQNIEQKLKIEKRESHYYQWMESSGLDGTCSIWSTRSITLIRKGPDYNPQKTNRFHYWLIA